MAHTTIRTSTSDVSRGFEDGRRPAAERWDRDRFERMRRGTGSEERERIHIEERDRPGRQELEVNISEVRKERPSRVVEREPYYSPTRRAHRDVFYEPTPVEVSNRALAPYRRKSVVERDVIDSSPRRPVRPQYLRRQSSLDTFDRRPVHRYGDQYRLPADVPIPLPIRRESPPRRRYRESEFEEIKYRDGHGSDFEEEYRETRIKREGRRRRRRRHSHAASTRASSSSSSTSLTTDVSPVRLPGKKGKTRMPKRLAHIKAITDLGYPYEEEEDFFVIRRALGKEQIDEIIEISKTIREVPAPPIGDHVHHDHHDHHDQHDHTEAFKKTTIEYQVPPGSAPLPPASVRAVSPARSVKSSTTHHSRRRSLSPGARSHVSRHDVVDRVELREESNHIHGPLAIVAPPRHHHRDHEIQREITALETERRTLRLEREADEHRALAERVRVGESESYEVVEMRDNHHHHHHHHHPRERDVVRVEKDRKVRSRSRPPNPKLVGLAMATLT